MKVVLLLMLVFMLSCTTTKYVEIPKETIKVEYRDKIKRDSIYIKDSIFSNTINDTVYMYKYKYIYKDKIEKDTINIVDTVKVSIPIEVVKEVNKLEKWQVCLMIFGSLSTVFFLFKIKNIFKIF